jgi:hypothetical protein
MGFLPYLLVAIGLCMVFWGAVVRPNDSMTRDARAECETAWGVFYQTREGHLCLRKDAVVFKSNVND